MARRTRRRFLTEGGTALVALSAWRPGRVEAAPAFDLVLRGGTVLDGTGAPAFTADVAVKGDAIAAVGDIAATQAARAVDARGLHVSPGFIDMHSHSDGSILSYPGAESRARQGITTEVTGNCGSSAAPLAGVAAENSRRSNAEDGVETSWTDVASFFTRLERTRFAVNQAMLVGQGTLREGIVGADDREAKPEELDRMVRALEEALEQGAVGLSTGLEYTPGRYTPTAEIVALSRVVARRGGFYASHIRNEERQLLEAVDEAIRIGRLAGVRVQISHVKASGRGNWGKQVASLGMIESARRDGVEVLGDAYPYTAYSTGLTVTFPSWALDGGDDATLKRLHGPERERIRREVDDYVRHGDPGDYDLIVIAGVRTEANRRFVGKNLAEVAAEWKVDPSEALLRIVDEEDTSVSYIGHGMSPENVERVLRHPLVMVGSDGYAMAPVGRALLARPHPRSYGCYPRVLGYYCRERKAFGLETAIRKMTSMPADQAGLGDRGRIARGKKADLVVFDAGSVRDLATFDEPQKYPEGIQHVLVNGTAVVENAAFTGARPGRVLRKS
ncbi:MAG TPA: D-aminoacylase [Vicinamibacteria bacterium]|nr:D-aminoacylase [Vicinamibacteria bacterium]